MVENEKGVLITLAIFLKQYSNKSHKKNWLIFPKRNFKLLQAKETSSSF
jgi:hypothetical protein